MDKIEVKMGAPVRHTRSKVTKQPITINQVGGSPFSGIFHEGTEKDILAGKFDYAVILRMAEIDKARVKDILEDMASI